MILIYSLDSWHKPPQPCYGLQFEKCRMTQIDVDPKHRNYHTLGKYDPCYPKL